MSGPAPGVARGVARRLVLAVDRYIMGPTPAERLGALRVLCGGFALVYVWARLPHLLGYATFDPAHFRPVGVVAVLDTPLVPAAAYAITVATALLAIPFFLGLRFRVVGPLFAALLLWTLTYRHAWGMIFHTDNLLALHILVLGLSRSADAWSLDARRRRRAGADPPAAHGRYGWPIRVMAWVVVIAYALAGWAKLDSSGTAWIWGDELRNYVAIDNARKALLGDIYSPLAAPLLHGDVLFRVLALFTVALELGAPVALLHRRIAAAWTTLAIGFHLGILALMMIAFPYPMLGVAFACFFAPERWLERARARVHAWRSGHPARPTRGAHAAQASG